MPIGMATGLMKWMVSDFIFFNTRQVGNIRISAMRTKDRALLYAFKSFWFAIHLFWPAYFHGFGRAIGSAVLMMIVGAYYIENIFVVNHIQEGLVPDSSAHWAEKQILGTANWGSVCGCKFFNYFFFLMAHFFDNRVRTSGICSLAVSIIRSSTTCSLQ